MFCGIGGRLVQAFARAGIVNNLRIIGKVCGSSTTTGDSDGNDCGFLFSRPFQQHNIGGLSAQGCHVVSVCYRYTMLYIV